MRFRGSVTLFLALILTSCCALICALLESARTAGVRCYAALALDAATDSLFSRYDTSLWEQYRILAYRYPGDARCTALLSETVNTYRENAGRYAFFDAEIGLPEKTFLGDGGGVWLEEELLAYMKEKPETDFPLTPEMLLLHTAELRRAERNAPVMPALSRLCAEAAECEASYFQTEQALLLAAAEKEAAASALSSGDLADFGAHSAALQAAIETSEHSAERCLEAGLRFESAEASLRETEAETADELSPIRDVLSESGENYRAERPELTALVSAAPALSQTLSAFDSEAAALAERIAEAEAEDDDEDGEGIDAAALWQELAAQFEAELALPSLSVPSGLIRDAEVLALSELLRLSPESREALCLPAASTLPAGQLTLGTSFSATLPELEPGTARSEQELCALAAYAAAFFPCFLSVETTTPRSGLSLQLEYLVGGLSSDRENFSAVCTRLFSDQESLRLLALLDDSASLQAAAAAADSLCTATASPRLRALLCTLILFAMAALDSLTDLSLLLSGEKAPLFTALPRPRLTAAQALQEGISLPTATQSGESPEGLDYRSALLFYYSETGRSLRNYRMMDLIEASLSTADSAFRLDQCLFALRAELRCNASHFFTGLSFSARPQAAESRFQISVRSFRAY